MVSADIRQFILIPGFTDLLTSENIKYNIRVAARASVPTIFRLYEGTFAQKKYSGTGS